MISLLGSLTAFLIPLVSAGMGLRRGLAIPDIVEGYNLRLNRMHSAKIRGVGVVEYMRSWQGLGGVVMS